MWVKRWGQGESSTAHSSLSRLPWAPAMWAELPCGVDEGPRPSGNPVPFGWMVSRNIPGHWQWWFLCTGPTCAHLESCGLPYMPSPAISNLKAVGIVLLGALWCKILSGIDIAPNSCADFLKLFKCKIPCLIWLSGSEPKQMYFCYNS